MSMKIDEVFNLITLSYKSSYQLFDCCDNRIHRLILAFSPFSIGICSSDVTAGVTVDHSIYIAHGKYLEDISLE